MTQLNETERKILNLIKEYDDGRGLPADFYSMTYSMENPDDTISEEAFLNILQKLVDAGKLKNAGTSAAGDELYRIADESEDVNQSSSRGNFFANLEREFREADPDQLVILCQEAMDDFIPASGMTDVQRIFQALVMAANIGTEGTGSLNDSEKALVDAIFGKILTSPMEPVYEMLSQPVNEQMFSMMELFCRLGGAAVGIPILRFILSFAYADKKLSDQMAEKLESVFGTVLLMDFFSSDPE